MLMASQLNEAIGSWVIRSVLLQVITSAKDPRVLLTLDDSARPAFPFHGGQLLPTRTIKPIGLPLAAFPTLVIHVAAHHESWADALERTREWMAASSAVQIAAGLVARGKKTRQLVWLARDPSGQVTEQLVDFHDASSSKPSQVSFYLAALYAGTTLPPSLEQHADTEIKLELSELREYIEELVQ
ncbi:hypothetical protein P43SY_004076 [Pythium insidiosum]|uniref:Uncharacterized protein n=1 Tax=Pythium insidiosum TaxID=114742 RepID=A0AAD5LX18_PYTIN|nr:hypothetical protein P43SY_004076 [Pythium insidiosum]